MPAGHLAGDLISYFSSAGVRPIQASCFQAACVDQNLTDSSMHCLTWPVLPVPPGLQPCENAANWMLDVAGGSAAGESKGPDFVAYYAVKSRWRSSEHASE